MDPKLNIGTGNPEQILWRNNRFSVWPTQKSLAPTVAYYHLKQQMLWLASPLKTPLVSCFTTKSYS